jgi:hypothetical protein
MSHTTSSSSLLQTPIPPPPPPPPPLPTMETELKLKVHESNDDRFKSIAGLFSRREQMMKEINDIFNNTHLEYSKHPMKRNTKVVIADADDYLDVREDKWYEDDVKEFNNEDSQVVTSSTTANEEQDEKEECSKTYYVCRSKDSETPLPINLCFPAKTTVIVVDRRKTDNGSHNFLCSLNVSREGKQKLLKQNQKEAEEELNSLPKGNIVKIMQRLGSQQDSNQEDD